MATIIPLNKNQQPGPNSVKKQVLQLYLEGLGFRSTGRFLGVSHVAVYNRVKFFGNKIEEIKSDNEIEMVELDERHSLLGIKNRCRIWIAVDRYGKRFINCVIGDRSAKTGGGNKLWDEIKEKDIGKIAENQ